MKSVLGVLLALVGVSAADDKPSFTPPAASPPDPTLPRPDSVDVLGTNAQQALVKLTSYTAKASYFGVVDLGTGCIVETYPPFGRVEKLLAHTNRTAEGPAWATRALADRDNQDEIRKYLALHARFGNRKDAAIYAGNFAWSGDGSKIVVSVEGALHRSRDGGQSYEQLDTNQAYKPYVTSDGRWAFYQRCASPGSSFVCGDDQKEIGIVDLDGASKPRIVGARGMIEGLDPTGRELLVVRDDEPTKVVATYLAPDTGAFRRAFAIPAPVLPKNMFFTITLSRGGRYGYFHHWISARTASVAVVDMTAGKIVHEQRRRFLGHEVDDDGRLSWGVVGDDMAYATTAKGVVRDLGRGEGVGWASGGRLIVAEKLAARASGKLGDVMCRVVSIKPVP